MKSLHRNGFVYSGSALAANHMDIHEGNGYHEETHNKKSNDFAKGLENNLIVQDAMMDDIVDHMSTPMGTNIINDNNSNNQFEDHLMDNIGDMMEDITPMGNDMDGVEIEMIQNNNNQFDEGTDVSDEPVIADGNTFGQNDDEVLNDDEIDTDDGGDGNETDEGTSDEIGGLNKYTLND